MTQTTPNEKNESLQPTEGAEMLERFWSEVRSEVDSISIVCVQSIDQDVYERIHSCF